MKKLYIIKNNITNKVYVGITTRSIRKRLEEHKRLANRGTNKPLYNAMNKYGFENFSIEIIFTQKNTSNDKLLQMEKDLIAKLNSMAPNGYNLTSGGELNKELSELSRNKIRQSAVGRTMSKETKAKISKTITGRERLKDRKPIFIIHEDGKMEWFNGVKEASKKYGKCISCYAQAARGKSKHCGGKRVIYADEWNGKSFKPKVFKQVAWNKGKKSPMLGKTLSKEVVDKISKSLKGRKAPNKCKVLLIHPDGTEELFESLTSAANKYNISPGHLSQVLSGKLKHAKSFGCKRAN